MSSDDTPQRQVIIRPRAATDIEDCIYFALARNPEAFGLGVSVVGCAEISRLFFTSAITSDIRNDLLSLGFNNVKRRTCLPYTVQLHIVPILHVGGNPLLQSVEFVLVGGKFCCQRRAGRRVRAVILRSPKSR